MSNTVTIQCENNLSISGVNLLYQDLKAAINDADKIILQASKVDRIDAASLQLFVALFNDSKKLGVNIQWKDPSNAVKDSAKILGLLDILKL